VRVPNAEVQLPSTTFHHSLSLLGSRRTPSPVKPRLQLGPSEVQPSSDLSMWNRAMMRQFVNGPDSETSYRRCQLDPTNVICGLRLV
jgi:hypothetical protein